MKKVKVGRNDPCPCGSGKKFKKCHMNTQRPVGMLKRAYKTEDDYVHRLIFGIGGIRDCAIRDKEQRNAFDKSFSPILQNLTEMKIAIDRCKQLIQQHQEDVENKKDAVFSGSQITVTDPIDDELNLLFKDVFIRGMMVTRCLNSHARMMGYNIEFMFADEEAKFKKGAEKFPIDKDDERFTNLASFIKNHKSAWYSAFRNMRKEIEHMGWSLPDASYQIDNQYRVHVVFPKVEGMEIPQLCDVIWKQIVLLCEEIVVYLLSLQLKDEMIVVRLPEEERDKHNKVRYIMSHRDMPGVPLSCS